VANNINDSRRCHVDVIFNTKFVAMFIISIQRGTTLQAGKYVGSIADEVIEFFN
jgi:ribosomal protein L27